ncbi:MAG: enoyl-CoA hydratase/isomerase family protein [Burkholderiales bacterium]
MTGRIQLRHQDGIAFVTLSHPGKLNAMSRAMWRDLKAVFEKLQAGDARCVVVQGEGGNFCAGGDIAEYPEFRFSEASLRNFHEHGVWGGLQAMLNCDVPLVAQIDGVCMGAGLEIAACCDVRVAGTSARFGAPIAKLGFPMAPREAQLLLRTAGELTARELLLQAVVLDAATMAQRGFLNSAVADSQVASTALLSAQRITGLAPQAARQNKQTLRALNQPKAADTALPDAYRYAASAEHQEGINAFLNKRQPVF